MAKNSFKQIVNFNETSYYKVFATYSKSLLNCAMSKCARQQTNEHDLYILPFLLNIINHFISRVNDSLKNVAITEKIKHQNG